MWPSDLTLALTLTLNFQGQIWNLLYLNQKWSDCHEKKNEHIDWTLGLKCDHQIWPWPWPWPWIFKVKYEICYISTKSGLIATRQKANISIWTLGLKFDNGFDLGHDLDIWIFKVICDLDHLVTKVRCKDLPDSDRGDFSCRLILFFTKLGQVAATLAITCAIHDRSQSHPRTTSGWQSQHRHMITGICEKCYIHTCSYLLYLKCSRISFNKSKNMAPSWMGSAILLTVKYM